MYSIFNKLKFIRFISFMRCNIKKISKVHTYNNKIIRKKQSIRCIRFMSFIVYNKDSIS